MVLKKLKNSLENPSKDRQRFIDDDVLISARDWSVKLSNFENLLETPFDFGLRMPGFAKLKRNKRLINIPFKTGKVQ